MNKPEPNSENEDEKIIHLDPDAEAKKLAEIKLMQEKHTKFVNELLAKGSQIARLNYESRLASKFTSKQPGKRSFVGVCRLNRCRVKAIIRKICRPVAKFISNQRILPIVFFKDAASTQPLMRHFQGKHLDEQPPSWWLVSQKKFFSYTVLAWKLWPRGQSSTIQQTTENKISPTVAETEEKKVMKTPTTKQDGKGLTIIGADDPAIAGFVLTLTETGSNARIANARIELGTPTKEYQIDGWLEKLGKPEEIKAKLTAKAGCLLKVFVFAKDGKTTPVSQHEFDAAATEKLFGTPKSETAPPTVPESGLSKTEVSEMITDALAALVSQITQAQAVADAKKAADAVAKAAEIAKSIEDAKAAEAAKKEKGAQQKQGEKFQWKSFFSSKLVRQCAGWLIVCLILIGLAWCYVHWDLGTKAKKYFASKQGSAAVAPSDSKASLGDMPVTPDIDPNVLTGTPAVAPKIVVSGSVPATTNSASGGSIEFGNITGSNNITAFIVHGNYTVNPPGMVIATNTTERSVSELHRNGWPQSRKPARTRDIVVPQKLKAGETFNAQMEIDVDGDEEFAYPYGFSVERFPTIVNPQNGGLETAPRDMFETAIDGKKVGNYEGLSEGKFIRFRNNSGTKMVIGFRCTKISESFGFQTAAR